MLITLKESGKLPGDVLLDILARLRPKTLLRLRCVCKDWLAFIDSPSFVTYYELYNTTPENKHMFAITSNGSQYQCMIFDSLLRKPRNIALPMASVKVVGYNNGLILLRKHCPYADYFVDHGRNSFILWNPIGKLLEIKLPPHHIDMATWEKVWIWFYYDTAENDCVLFFMPYWDEEPLIDIDMYTTCNDSWSKIVVETKLAAKSSYHKSECVFVNGTAHWIGLDYAHGNKYVNQTRGTHIAALDVHSKVVRRFELPESDRAKHCRRHLGVVGEALALLDMRKRISYVGVMERYGIGDSWVKLHTINDVAIDRVLYFKGSRLILWMKVQRMQAYDFDTQQMRNVYSKLKDIVLIDIKREKDIVLMDEFLRSWALPVLASSKMAASTETDGHHSSAIQQ